MPYKISVIIPVFNTEAFLARCLESVANQTLGDCEVICIDDGSTDNSLKILETFAQKDLRFKIYTKENGGQSSARNIGINQAKGEYLYFLDSDDYIKNNAFERLYPIAELDNLDILYFDGETVYSEKQIPDHLLFYKTYYCRRNEYAKVYSGIDLFSEMNKNADYRVTPCLQFINRKFLHRIALKYFEGIIYEDNLFTFIAMLSANRVKHIKDTLYMRTIRPGSTTMSQKDFSHFYGFFTCMVNMLIYTFSSGFPDYDKRFIYSEIMDSMQSNAIRIYKNLPAEEKLRINTFTPTEELFFDKFIKTELKESEANTLKKKPAHEIALINKIKQIGIIRNIYHLLYKMRFFNNSND